MERLPLESTFVVIRTFSNPALNRSKTASRCSTVKSPESTATEWPSEDIFPASQPAVLRVYINKIYCIIIFIM